MEDIPATIVEKPSHVTKESEDKDDYDLDDTLLNFMNLITLEHIGRVIQIIKVIFKSPKIHSMRQGKMYYAFSLLAA